LRLTALRTVELRAKLYDLARSKDKVFVKR